MTTNEEISALIVYLSALADVQHKSDVRVHAEIRRAISKIERLLND
ncbi:hypothetical protein V7152_24600 [Neobacillus drentensis]